MAKTVRRASDERDLADTTPTETAAAVAQALQTATEADSHSRDMARADRVEAKARRKHEQAQRGEQRKHPSERTSDQQLWRQAHKEATAEERRERIRGHINRHTRTAVRQTHLTLRLEATSLWQRNRKQLAPWCVAAPYALFGVLAAQAATRPHAAPAAVAVIALLLAAGGSWLGWRVPINLGKRLQRPRLRDRIPARHRPKLQAGTGLATVWVGGMPLVHGPPQAGMWLALVAGTTWLSLSWWREHDHPIPEAPNREETPVPQTTDAPVDAELARINQIVNNWHNKVTASLVPGSTIVFHGGSITAVLSFAITLDSNERVTRNGVKQQIEQIGMKLGVFEDRLSFETGQHPGELLMHLREQDPVFTFDRPIVLCNGQPAESKWDITPGANVDIVFGQHIDGSGYASIRFLQKGSVNSAFLLGGMGSGKTRTLEIIAVGLRMLGCYLLWLDGQEGASSPLLNEEANETFEFNMHDREDDHGVREFTEALGAICKRRNRSLQDNPEFGGAYVYDPARPPVVAMMDEAHEAFQTKHPTVKTYGLRLESYAVQLRKLGVSMVCLSQDYDQTNTFGRSGRLRDSLVTAGNMVAMRVTNRSRIGMLPSTCPALDKLPGRGYGFLPLQDRPDAMWRTLDLGDDVQATLRSWMGQYEPGRLEFTRESVPGEPEPDGPDGPDGPAELDGGGPVRFIIGQPNTTPDTEPDEEADEVEPDGRMVTAAEQRALHILLDEGEQTPTSLGQQLGISSQAAGKQLRSLVAKVQAVRADNGAYRAIVGGEL